MAVALLSLPTTHQISQLPTINANTRFHGSITFIKCPSKPIIPLCSSSSSSTSVAEDSPSSSPDAIPAQLESAIEEAQKLPPRGCEACGREELEKGCNGKGRIQGGIATVPGFGWWPIKAYRPCPGFVAAGGRYRRQGQSMDEVVSGRGKRTSGEVQSSKEK